MTTERFCECHDQPLMFNADKRSPAGGYWVCRVKRNERARRVQKTPGTYAYDFAHGIGAPGERARAGEHRRRQRTDAQRAHGSGRGCYKGGRPESGTCAECLAYDTSMRSRYDRTKYREQQRQYREEHREELSERRRQRYLANPVQREYMRRRRVEEPERLREIRNRSARRHPETIAEAAARRRARKAGAGTDGHTRIQVFERDRGHCQLCGVELDPRNWHEDHIVPLAAGGSDLLSNVQATCPPCNLSKGAKTA